MDGTSWLPWHTSWAWLHKAHFLYCCFFFFSSAFMASQGVQSSLQQPVPLSCITLRTLTSMMRWGIHVAWMIICSVTCRLSLLLCPQVKIELPTQLHEKHHLLFSFYHVTCDINAKTNAKRKESLETPGETVVKDWLFCCLFTLVSQTYNLQLLCLCVL